MRSKRLQNQITTGRFSLPAVTFVCILCWVAVYFLVPEHTRPATGNSLFSFSPSAIDSRLLYRIQQIGGFLLYAVIGYFLIELNNRFNIIRMRASVQTATYFLLVTVCPQIHPLRAEDFASPAFLISLYFLFKSYQQQRPEGQIFHSFFFIGVGSLLFPQLTILAVFWLLGAHRFQALTLRSFCAALLGWMLPYWMLFGHAFVHNEMELFYQPFIALTTLGKFFDIQSLQTWQLAMLGYLLVLFIVSALHCAVTGFEDKIRTRSYLQFLIELSIFLFLLIALQPIYFDNLLPLLMISCSFLFGHFFTLTGSRGSNLFFIAATIGLILLFAYNIWTLL